MPVQYSYTSGPPLRVRGLLQGDYLLLRELQAARTELRIMMELELTRNMSYSVELELTRNILLFGVEMELIRNMLYSVELELTSNMLYGVELELTRNVIKCGNGTNT